MSDEDADRLNYIDVGRARTAAPRIQVFQNLVVHYRGHDSEEERRFREVVVTYHADGWVSVRRGSHEFDSYPPGGIIRLVST